MVDAYFSSGIANGKTGIEKIKFEKSDLEEKGIASVEKSEFKLHFFRWGSSDWNIETEAISVQ